MQAAILVVFALVATAAANPGLLAAPAVAIAPAPAYVAHPAPVFHAAPVAVPVATSHSYKVRAPAAKILTASPVFAAPVAHGPVLLH